jgi:hypothetical protein
VISRIFDHWLTQDALVIGAFAFVFFLLRAGARNERWQRAWVRLKQDRTGLIAFGAIVIYLVTGALDLLQIPVATGGSRSILDAMTANVAVERTYSAPLASELFGSPRSEALEGRHLLGTDVLGKDVFVQTLKACRTALIIGGLTSAIYVPLGALLGILAGYFRRWVDDVIQYVYSTLASIPKSCSSLRSSLRWKRGSARWQSHSELRAGSRFAGCFAVRRCARANARTSRPPRRSDRRIGKLSCAICCRMSCTSSSSVPCSAFQHRPRRGDTQLPRRRCSGRDGKLGCDD